MDIETFSMDDLEDIMDIDLDDLTETLKKKFPEGVKIYEQNYITQMISRGLDPNKADIEQTLFEASLSNENLIDLTSMYIDRFKKDHSLLNYSVICKFRKVLKERDVNNNIPINNFFKEFPHTIRTIMTILNIKMK